MDALPSFSGTGGAVVPSRDSSVLFLSRGLRSGLASINESVHFVELVELI